jgi:hypothetical protein
MLLDIMKADKHIDKKVLADGTVIPAHTIVGKLEQYNRLKPYVDMVTKASRGEALELQKQIVLTRHLTPAERTFGRMVYTVTPNGQPYLDAVEAGKPFRAGYYWDKATDKYVKAPADEIYFSGQPALDRIYDFKKNRIGDKPMIIAVRLTAKDLVDTKLLEMASRQEVFDEPKYFSIDVGFGEFTPGGRVKFPAILDEQTAKMGVDFYALKGEDGEIFTTKVRHSGLGVVIAELEAYQDRVVTTMRSVRHSFELRLNRETEDLRIQINADRTRFRIAIEARDTEIARLLRQNERFVNRGSEFPWEAVLTGAGGLLIGVVGDFIMGFLTVN